MYPAYHPPYFASRYGNGGRYQRGSKKGSRTGSSRFDRPARVEAVGKQISLGPRAQVSLAAAYKPSESWIYFVLLQLVPTIRLPVIFATLLN